VMSYDLPFSNATAGWKMSIPELRSFRNSTIDDHLPWG
jgi:hypothetical protein